MNKILHDLFNIEVNTIVTSCTIGAKFPDIQHGLYDIVKCYQYKLEDLEKQTRTDCEDLIVSSQTFERFKVKAKELVAMTSTAQSDIVILERIRYMSGQIKPILERVGMTGDIRKRDLPTEKKLAFFKADELLIRKAWELEIATIAMQTVIQLDGDIITRIAPEFSSRKHDLLQQIHEMSVKTAIGYWEALVHLAFNVLKNFLGAD